MSELLTPGEPAPWFHAQSLSGNARYAFDNAAGRWIVLLMLGSGASAEGRAAIQLMEAHRALFDDHNACFFGVTTDPGDAAQDRIAFRLPGIRWFLDYDRQVSSLYGATAGTGASAPYTAHWLLLDPMMCVHQRAPLAGGPAIFAELKARLRTPVDMPAAPVLVVPNVLPPALCRHLIDLYERNGGLDSGFMLEQDGVTTLKLDHEKKRRADCSIKDPQVIEALKARVQTVLRPLIMRAFQFDASRIERSIVARYDAADGGHFRAHRDNTTKGTAHRKFACTINLNAEDYEGGDLWFPEFGRRSYRAPTGGAVIFSCSLLHEAQPVTKGRRYAYLPFLYDDAAARIREQNLQFVTPNLQNYRSGLPVDEKRAANG